MDLLFQSTKKFEKDLKGISNADSKRIISRLNQNCDLLQKDPAAFYRTVHRPLIPKLKEGMDSTLYSMRIDRDFRILMTVDEDPLFDRVIFSLLRLVRHKDLEKAFKGIAKALYQSSLAGFSSGGDRDRS